MTPTRLLAQQSKGAAWSRMRIGASPTFVAASIGGYLQRILRLTRDRWQPIAAFLLLLFSVEVARAWSVADYAWTSIARFAIVEIGPIFVASGTGAVLGPLLAAGCGRSGWFGAFLAGIMTIAGVGAGVELLEWLHDGPVSLSVREGRVLSDDAFALRSLWFYSAAGLLFAGYCSTRDRHLEIVRAAHAAELERADAQRAVMESRLKVLQARVEPAFLFGTLGQVQTLYRRTPALAEQMLDELIHYLRAALPQMRGDGSTIAREIELVRAYLAVLQVARGDRLAVEIRSDPAIAATRFPPMVLLPLVQRCVTPDAAEPSCRITVDSSAEGSALRITIRAQSEGTLASWRDDELTGMREALAGICGNESTLAFATHDHVHCATIVVPSAATISGAG